MTITEEFYWHSEESNSSGGDDGDGEDHNYYYFSIISGIWLLKKSLFPSGNNSHGHNFLFLLSSSYLNIVP